jgi:hypothetical protein
MSSRDIKPIIDNALKEKERKDHKSLAVQAYELFSNGMTPLQIAVHLNLREAEHGKRWM